MGTLIAVVAWLLLVGTIVAKRWEQARAEWSGLREWERTKEALR